MTYSLQSASSFISLQERARLVRFCARFTGESESAEDLAQETLLEAWSHLEGLRDTEKRLSWLFGIARNVCLRWGRQCGRDQARYVPLATVLETEYVSPEDTLVDPFDIEIELERKELVALLDRALAALPPETRATLVKHYVDESPLAEIAAQLGTDPSAVAMRLQRGKLVLRRLFFTDMQAEIASYAPQFSQMRTREATRLWCPLCGQHHLRGWLNSEGGSLVLTCPACCRDERTVLYQTHNISLLGGVKGYKRALSRIATWEQNYYQAHLPTGQAPCPGCGRATLIQHTTPGNVLSCRFMDSHVYRLCGSEQRYGLSVVCALCNSSCVTFSDNVISWLPEAQQFLREHPRVYTLPDRGIEVDGRSACVVSMQSITDSSQLDIILALDTFTVLQIHRGDAQ